MAWHYHKKQEQINAACVQTEKMFKQGYDVAKSDDFIDYFTGLKLGSMDNEKEKKLFDIALLSEQYDDIRYWIWEIPYEISSTVSMMTELEHDIYGEEINNLQRDSDLKKIYLNIFPANGKSFCIWSWLNRYDDTYKKFAEQFSKLDITDRENYFNNNLPRWTDSIVISPRLWNMWSSELQESLIAHANFDVLYRAMEKEDDDYAYKYMDTPWNFFEEILT